MNASIAAKEGNYRDRKLRNCMKLVLQFAARLPCFLHFDLLKHHGVFDTGLGTFLGQDVTSTFLSGT
jgi:hypothetical protein